MLVAADVGAGASIKGAASAAEVGALRLGTVGGAELRVVIGDLMLACPIERLEEAWRTPF